MRRKRWTVAVGSALLALTAVPAHAALFAASSGSRSAEADFQVSGTTLVITLRNTSTADALNQKDVLTGVFFNSAVSLNLVRVSAVLGIGSSVQFPGPNPTDPDPDGVGGEWAYRGGLDGSSPREYGVSSAGLGLFGSGDLFPGANLAGVEGPGGVQYGILPAGDNPATGNDAVTGNNPLIKWAVVFRLSGLPANFNPATQIGDVRFQYGTSLSDPYLDSCGPIVQPPQGPPPVPEPLTWVLVSAGLLTVARVAGVRRSG